MAENNTNQPLVGGDSENFMRLMNRALTRIEQVDSATTKANASLSNYAKTFDTMNEKLEEYVRLSANAKSQKFDRITVRQTGGGSGRSSGSSGGRSNSNSEMDKQAKDYMKQANSVTESTMKSIFNSIDNLGGKYSRTINNVFGQVGKFASNGKNIVKGVKSVRDMSKAQEGAEVAAETGAKAFAGLSSEAVLAAGAVGAVALVFGAMAAAGKYAYERNMELNRSLMSMGDTSNEMTSSSSKTANGMVSLKNSWVRIGDNLSKAFEPVFSGLVGWLDSVSKKVEGVTSGLNPENSKSFSPTDSKARWYTNELQRRSNEPENTSLPVISGIASTAKQSGFDNTSAANLAIGTYDLAMKKAKQYGVEAADVADKLSEAWLKGGESAKEYGVVVDDQTLMGYMATKGVDIANVQISDAMRQYYRYQLMQEELNADSSDAMQNQVKGWKQLGMQIDATKQKLFSFDEVIQLSAIDTSIPTVGTPSVSYPNGDKNETGSVVPPIGPVPPGGGPTPGTAPSPAPVSVPLVYVPQNEYALAPVVAPVLIPVMVPGLEMVGNLVYELGLLWGMLPVPVTVPVTIPGFDSLPSLQEVLDGLKARSPVPVSVPVTVPGFELAPTLLGYCKQLATVFPSIVAFSIPALSLAPQLIGYLHEIAQNWKSEVNLSVVGMELLAKAEAMLQRVIGLMNQVGSVMSSGYNTVKNGVAGAYNSAKDYVTGGSDSWATAAKAEGYSASDINTAKSMASKNGASWDSLGSYQKSQYVKVADTVNSNPMINQADGIEMLNSYNATGTATSSKVNWMNTTGTQYANTALKGAGVLGGTGAVLLTGGLAAPSVAPLLEGAGTAVSGWLSGLASAAGSLVPAMGLATGGIGTKEMSARLFEGGKKEDVIPLESQAGIDHLAGAMKIALGQENSGGGQGGSGTTINLTLTGIFDTDDESKWTKMGEKLAEVIDIQKMKRGELNYGGSF